MKIQFYIPDDEQIPTYLRLKIEDKYCTYTKCKDCFGYDFTFYDTTYDEAYKMANEIASIFEAQSEDHGATWRKTSIELVAQTTFRIKFIIRDSY